MFSLDLLKIVVSLGIGAVLFVIIWQILKAENSRSVDIRHPPIIKSKIPIIGHLYGLLKHQSVYFEILRLDNTSLVSLSDYSPENSSENCSYPIFGISVFGRKIYIVADADIISPIHRSKTLSFEPLVLQFAQRLMGASDAFLNRLRDVPPGEKEHPFSKDTHSYRHATMQPGPALYKMNAAVLKNVADVLDEIDTDGVEVNLWLWIRDMLTSASTSAMFGRNHPLLDSDELIQALWLVLFHIWNAN